MYFFPLNQSLKKKKYIQGQNMENYNVLASEIMSESGDLIVWLHIMKI